MPRPGFEPRSSPLHELVSPGKRPGLPSKGQHDWPDYTTAASKPSNFLHRIKKFRRIVLKDMLSSQNIMDMPSKNIHITHDNHPYPHWILQNVFPENSAKQSAAALDSFKFTRSVSDLFQFWQTADFKTLKLPQPLHELYHHFSSKNFISYIAKLTHTKLSSTIDMSAFRYEDTDYLLPHDDQLEGRKIAYVLNLSTLKEKEGGALELFENNKSNPTKFVKRYQPVFNSLVLFQVSPTSWHQVAEVIKKNRLTITGWFHD